MEIVLAKNKTIVQRKRNNIKHDNGLTHKKGFIAGTFLQ